MKLYLVQHGDAVAKSVDPDRPLSDSGRRDIEKLAAFLSHHGIRVARTIHSGKTRAMQTAELLASVMPEARRPEIYNDLGPQDSTHPLYRQLKEQTEDLLVVGHMPFLGKLVSQLIVGNDAVEIVNFLPGSIVSMERGNEALWSLNWMLRPEVLN